MGEGYLLGLSHLLLSFFFRYRVCRKKEDILRYKVNGQTSFSLIIDREKYL